MIFSIVVFGFVGGITGVTFGTEQINIIAHNTLRIPGHFHATVVSGTALAFMGLTYYVIPLIFRKRIAFYPLARIQPWLFAIGMLVFSLMMTFAGTFGVPRRHWDITFSGAPFDVQFNPAVNLVMGIMALGGLMAAAGGGIYILVTVWSVFFGERLPEGPLTGHGLPPGIVTPPKPIPAGEHSRKTPGTLVLVFVFLAAFIAYYFINWKLLSAVWKIG
jgi:cytochrome c oxidase subunit 1